MKKVASWLKSRITKSDFYPQTVSLTYQGQSGFQTFFGGLISLVILVVMISYSIRILLIMIQKEETTVTLNRVINDIQNNPIEFNVNGGNFAFTFAPFDETTGSREYDPTYLNITVAQATLEVDLETGGRTTTEDVHSHSI